MRIAVVTDDGQSVSPHFGRARMYAVLTVENGAIVSREFRDKAAPHWLAARPSEDESNAGVHGSGPAAEGKHRAMLVPISDCACLITGGMGGGAYEHVRSAGIRPIVTTLDEVDEAAIACEAGSIVDEVDRLH